MSTTCSSLATPSQVWQLLGDVTTWAAWAPIREATLEEPAAHGGDGLGAIRSLRTAAGTTREQVTVYDEPHHLGYVLLSGLPLEGYRSDVILRPQASGGSVITWVSTFHGSWLGERITALIIDRFCSQLAKAAPRLVATSPASTAHSLVTHPGHDDTQSEHRTRTSR